MNLFDTFNSEGVNQQDTQVGDNVYPFTTPNQTPYPNLNPFRPSSSSSFKIPSFSLFDEDELLQDSPLEPSNVNTSPHHIHQANPHRVSVQDETLSCGDEMLEEMFKEDPDNIPDTWLLDEEDATEPENSQPPDPIPERGYDKDFWEPLIKEHLGGSHAAEVMAGIHVPKTAPETYQSYTGNAFDHPVRVSGVDDTDWKKDLDFMGVHQREGPPVQCKTPNTRVRRADPNTLGPDVHTQSPYTDTSSDSPYTPLYGVHSGLTSTHTRNNLLSPRTPRSTHGRPREPIVQTPPPRETRPLSDISDKEFDIPPLFDDLSFENDDVPDLNLEDTDGEPHANAHHNTRCDWRILAKELTTCGYYTIKKAQLDHTCPLDQRDQYKTKATSKVIAHIYRSRYGEPNEGPKAPQLQQLVLEDLRVSASYMKCHRAKGQAVDTASRFLYAFLSFGASIQGFRRVRPVLIIDGTHLTGKYKGVLLTASGQDANFQGFPLAFAVIDGENDNLWLWFLTKVERIIADSTSLTIISNRHASILKAKALVFPKAHFAACIVHIMRNVVSRFKSKGLAKLVCAAAFSFKRKDFDDNFGKIQQTNAACAKYLEDIGTAKWTRTYFPGNRYNLLTSNVAEQLNKVLKKSKPSLVVEQFMFIQRMLTRWFSARRTKSSKHTGLVTPEVASVIDTHIRLTKGSKIANITDWSSQVKGHALLVADSIGLPHVQLVGECFKTLTWKDTYCGVIYPEAPFGEFTIPPAILSLNLQPPNTRRPSGRPKDKRIPSTSEIQAPKKTKINRCGRCGHSGHNRTNCDVPI
ncbi:hypothetical protein BRARA_H00600 [Brassica rapa]|uniref:MULE transposase domain-containing protein n=1 Tax=Brassica campestris TaxID=3711 RepID=A0A397Y978_BRACM|nr:hypothetical protein BRARA_H00600 [Brassica rapa]